MATTTAIAAAAQDATSQALVCLLFYFIFYYTNVYFKLIYLQTMGWDKRGLEMRRVLSLQVSFFFYYY